ncbi:MAG: hypothetical protein HYY16_17455 [Planctomycetes bacterium]|nr:hypothetical protein [Planctomycetota bacterium]
MRRSLTNIGGPVRSWGAPEPARALAECLDVKPVEKLPFTHGFHPYPARMHPETARRVIERFAPSGRILDPFVGSGTTAVEAIRAGRPFIGTDVSRVATEIAWARTRVWTPEDCRRIEREGRRIAREARTLKPETLPPWAEAERAWYSLHTIEEIVALKALIETVENEDVRRFLTVALSSLLIKLSKQESDSITAPARGFRPWPVGAARGMFAERCSEATKMLLLLSSDLYKRKIQAPDPEFRVADARTVSLEPTSEDLVFTSPPYPGTYDYTRQHRLRFAIIGADAAFTERHEIGARREFDPTRYAEDLRTCLRRMLPARLVILIGDGAEIRSDRLLRDLIAPLGARLTAGASQERIDRSFDRRGQRRHEHLLLVETVRPEVIHD